MRNRYWRLGLLVIAAGALLFWTRGLGQRVMHQDEAIGADKFHSLWATHKYVYDPHEYHGPTLNYFTLPVVWVSGAKTYPETTEAMYRMVTVLFGVGVILLMGLVADGLGWPAVLCSAVLMAISPAMSFYSRYYIHEILLVFFIFLAIASGWRYSQSGRKRWAYLCGAALGLAYATKETWVLSLGAMVIGLGLALLWSRRESQISNLKFKELLSWKIWLGAGIFGIVVAAIFFSGLFTNWNGPIDAVKTYFTYIERGTGKGDHDKPFGYYLGLLSYFRYGRGPIHTEVFILILAGVGVIRALWPSSAEQLGRVIFLRFIAFYSVGLMLIYSAIRYKTPWCLLSFWHGMILLAGLGAVTLVRLAPHLWMRYIVAVILIVPAGQLAYQAWRINFDAKFAFDQRLNPYLYSTPGRDFLRLVERVEDLAKVSPMRRSIFIRVVSNDCWPLPWYLRGFERVEYWNTSSARDPYADVVIGAATDGDLELRLEMNFAHPEHFGLRRGVVLAVYVEEKLWKEYRKTITGETPVPR